MHFERGSVFAGGRTNGTGDLLSGEVNLDVVFHVILPSHGLVTHVAPPLSVDFGHVHIKSSCNTAVYKHGSMMVDTVFLRQGLATERGLVDGIPVQSAHVFSQAVSGLACLLTYRTVL